MICDEAQKINLNSFRFLLFPFRFPSFFFPFFSLLPLRRWYFDETFVLSCFTHTNDPSCIRIFFSFAVTFSLLLLLLFLLLYLITQLFSSLFFVFCVDMTTFLIQKLFSLPFDSMIKKATKQKKTMNSKKCFPSASIYTRKQIRKNNNNPDDNSTTCFRSRGTLQNQTTISRGSKRQYQNRMA